MTVCFCFPNCSLCPRLDICLSSVESIGFYNALIDYSGGVLVRVFRSFQLHIGSPCLFVGHQELASHGALTIVPGVWESAHKCPSPLEPSSSFSLGVVAIWHICFVRWKHEQRFRLRLWLIIGFLQENPRVFDLLGWRQLSRIHVLLWLLPLIEAWRIPYGKLLELSVKTLRFGC